MGHGFFTGKWVKKTGPSDDAFFVAPGRVKPAVAGPGPKGLTPVGLVSGSVRVAPAAPPWSGWGPPAGSFDPVAPAFTRG